MKRSFEVEIAHKALCNIKRQAVICLVDSVNLTPQEKAIIIKSEIEKMRIAEIAECLHLSCDSIMRIKTNGMRKIARYIQTTI